MCDHNNAAEKWMIIHRYDEISVITTAILIKT